MSKEYMTSGLDGHLLIDIHSGHTRLTPGDDGLQDPSDMVDASYRKRVVPGFAGHNTLHRWSEYLDAMQERGLGQVAMPSVEWGFSTRIGDYGMVAEIPVVRDGEVVHVHFGPGKSKFADGMHRPDDRYDAYTPESIDKTHELLRSILIDFSRKSRGEDVTREQLLSEISRGTRGMVIKALIGGLTDQDREIFEYMKAFETVLIDVGFAAYYMYARDMVGQGRIHTEVPELVDFQEWENPKFIVRMAYTYWHSGMGNERMHTKGEILTVLPPRPELLKKFEHASTVWREGKMHQEKSFVDLLSFLADHVTPREFEDILWYYPHPVSIDITTFGRFVVHRMEGNVSLYAPELLIPEFTDVVDAVEVLNAAHPGRSNRVVGDMVSIDLLRDKARMGSSDSHHSSWIGTAATLIKPDEFTTEGIFDAVRNSHTLPVSGLGERSGGWLPFFLWVPTVPVKGINLTPKFIFDRIARTSDVYSTARKVLERNEFPPSADVYQWAK